MQLLVVFLVELFSGCFIYFEHMHSHQTSFNNIILDFSLTFLFNGRFDKISISIYVSKKRVEIWRTEFLLAR